MVTMQQVSNTIKLSALVPYATIVLLLKYISSCDQAVTRS